MLYKSKNDIILEISSNVSRTIIAEVKGKVMSGKISFRGTTKSYIQWPLRMSIAVFAFAGAMFFLNMMAGICSLAFAVVFFVVSLVLYLTHKNNAINEMVSFATQYGQIQKQLLRDLEIPYALLDETGHVIWTNEAFERATSIKKGFKKQIFAVIPEITKDDLPDNLESETEREIYFNEKDYRISMKKISMDALSDPSADSAVKDAQGFLVAFFMIDETKINSLVRENDEQKLACGLIYIDNYDEALDSIEEVRRSLLSALIERKINKCFSGSDAIIKKLENDKYFVAMQKKYLQQHIENRFDVLEDVKTLNIGNDVAVTLSIGFGIDTGSFRQDYEYARAAIDLALGRGGDQAIIKSPDEISYFGGKSQKNEKNTRVKARVKAHALKEIVENTDQLIIMGHKILDVDAFGAAVGIYRVAKTFNKKAHIVVDQVTTSIRPMIEAVIAEESHEKDLFLSNEEAINAVTFGTTLVVVDVNKPSYTECPELLKKCESVVVIDHHRQGSERIEGATLAYIEPYASSASEMVAEILQYISDNVKLTPSEADAMYSGIMIDTNNFMTKTGVRTFEAAAFLRRNGADVTRVRKLFRDDVSSYKARAEIVRHAEVYDNAYAISEAGELSVESPTIVGAQAANELLNINGIKASFVLTSYQNEIYISARSIDEVNVQVIMERLGGGGHMNIAGAQLKEVSIDEAKKKLVETLAQMQREGVL